jgi:hypothetical protein
MQALVTATLVDSIDSLDPGLAGGPEQELKANAEARRQLEVEA